MSTMVTVLKETFFEFMEDDCTTTAAAMAYFTAFSIPPLLVIVVTVAGMVWDPQDVQGELQHQVAGIIGEGGWVQIKAMMTAVEERAHGGSAALIGTGVLLFGATGVMAQLQHALNRAWQVQPDPQQNAVGNFLMKRVLSFAMVLVVAFLLLVSLVITALLSAASGTVGGALPEGMRVWLPRLVDLSVSYAVITLLFAAMFKWLPDAEIAWMDVWRGATVTTLLFMLGKFAIGYYLGTRNTGVFGPAASFALILMWIYYSSLIFLLGAEFTQVFARHCGKQIRPARGAVRMKKQQVHMTENQSAPTNSPRAADKQ